MTGGLTADEATGAIRPIVRISSPNGRVTVVAEARTDVAVEGHADVGRDGTQTTITTDDRVLVRVPEFTDVIVGTGSSRVDLEGRMGNVAIVTESGRINVEHAAQVDARSASGRVAVGDATGTARVRTASGTITIQSCGGAEVATESGRITVGDARGEVRAHCVSGRIEIELLEAHDVDAETVSGRIEVSFPQGIRVRRTGPDGSEDMDIDDCDCTVSTRSVSGRVAVESR